jgi:hypothetical protein
MGLVTDASGLSPAQTRVAAALLSTAWGERAEVLVTEALPDRTHVFRLRLDGGRSAVLKRRDRDGEAGGFGIELATLEYLNAMPVPVAPRLLGADAEAGLMLMEDLGAGPSLADSLLAGSPLAGRRDRARAGCVPGPGRGRGDRARPGLGRRPGGGGGRLDRRPREAEAPPARGPASPLLSARRRNGRTRLPCYR